MFKKPHTIEDSENNRFEVFALAFAVAVIYFGSQNFSKKTTKRMEKKTHRIEIHTKYMKGRKDTHKKTRTFDR